MIENSNEAREQRLTDHGFWRKRHTHINVAPRYTAGSPAMVGMVEAHHVARGEIELYQLTPTEDRERGLAGIVEARIETRKGWEVIDLITGAAFVRPFAVGS